MKRTMFPLIALVALLGLIGCASDPAVAPATVDAADSQRPAEDLPEPLPVDPAVTVGRLGNGLTYYIRENDEPEDRAFLRLAVNAGSILEDERQLGLAHFLEHMAFNGTETYSGNEIIAFLETLGMAFGPDVNAYTGFDQTVYELTLPTDDPERFSTGLNVLVEWAHWMTLSDEEIEKERGVIIEEWRFRRSASSRMHEEQYPVLFWNSRYAERLPIGDIELIAEFPPEDLRRFYRDWYRPELMAVVAVGDFQTAEVEALINEYFGAIPATPEPVERPTFEVPGHPDTKYVVASDPEAPYTDVSFIVKRDREELATEVDYRNMLVGDLFSAMLNARLEEISLQEEAPFLAAGVSLGPLVRTESAAGLSAVVEGNAVGPALEALVVEARRVVEHGFTETELARARANRLRAMEQLYRERENLNSASFADEYVRAYLEGEAIPGIPVELELTERLLPTIPLAEVNTVADEYLKESNRVVMVSAVERDDLPEVTEAQLRQAVIVAESAPVQPYQDREVAQIGRASCRERV
jgi:zinc protease